MSNNTSNNTGKFFIVAAIATATGYLVHLIRAAKAAQSLRYALQQIQLYHIASGGNIVLRVWMEFTNLEAAALTIRQLYLDIFLNFGTAENPSYHRIGTLNTNNQPIIIPGYQTVKQSFDISIPWANLGVAAARIIAGLIVQRQPSWPTSAKVEGQIKAEGFTVPVSLDVPFNANQNRA